jgi:hypothetical protein
MVEGTVLRLFTFRAVRPAFDEILRHELVPDLVAQRGILDCYSGRQGPDEVGPRLVASVWTDAGTMTAALGEELGHGQFHPELLDETTDRVLEVLPIRIAARLEPGDGRVATILRMLWGRVVDMGLDEYLADVRSGTEADVRAGIGPVALYVAESAPDAFITVSAWRDWADVERATGGDVHRPRATRHGEHLLDWDVAHFEIVQSMAGPSGAVATGGAG